MSLSKPIDIAFLKSRLGQKGGLEKYTYRLLDAFEKKGCNTFLLCSTSSGSLTANQIFFPAGPFPQYIQLEKFDKKVQGWLKKHKPPLIFGMDRNTHQTHLRLGNGIHRAYLEMRKSYEGKVKKWSFSWNPLHKKVLQLEKRALENPRLVKVFTNSHMIKEQALHYYSIDPSKIEVVHNGVEWHEKASFFEVWQEKKEEFLQELSLEKGIFTFLFVGSGFKRKGLIPLLKALSFIKKEPFRLLIIGKDKHLSVYQRLTKKLGLAKKVLFLGEKKDPYPYYQLADALAIPSFYDPFANVTLEALAMGLKVITSSYNGGSEVITPENGIIVSSVENEEEMKEALVKALKTHKTQESAISIRESVKHLDFSHQLEKITELTLSSVL